MLRRRIAGTVCSVTVALLGLAAVPGVAAAAQSPAPSSASTGPSGYPAQGPLLTVSSGSVRVGGSVIVTGHGFNSGEGVDLSVTYAPANHALGSGGPVAQSAAFSLRYDVGHAIPAGHALVAADGDFSTHLSLTQAGNATITATGDQSHLSLVATVSVLPATTVAATNSTKRELPFSSIQLMLVVAALVALLVAAGIARRRRRPTPPVEGFPVPAPAPEPAVAANSVSTA